MSAIVCSHGMPSPTSCLECMNEHGVGPIPEDPVTVVAHFVARYTSDCSGCDRLIRPGDGAVALSDGRFMHDGCEPGGESW